VDRRGDDAPFFRLGVVIVLVGLRGLDAGRHWEWWTLLHCVGLYECTCIVIKINDLMLEVIIITSSFAK
jgi:hypothetical protein